MDFKHFCYFLGAIGLTETPQALRRWCISGPEVARLLREFEEKYCDGKNDTVILVHHEAASSMQETFVKDVINLIGEFVVFGHPFLEDSPDRYSLKEVKGEVIVAANIIEQVRKEQFESFFKNMIASFTEPLINTIKKNKFPLLKKNQKKLSKHKSQIKNLKDDITLFSRLYIACQCRDGNLEEFFAHENHSYPSSISVFGDHRFGKKLDLLQCITEINDQSVLVAPDVDVIILDVAAIVNMMRPVDYKTFGDYSLSVFQPYGQNF